MRIYKAFFAFFVRRSLSALIIFCTSHLLPVSAANVSNYAELQAAITAQDPAINFVGTPINWGTLLQVGYNVVFNNQVGSPIVFSALGASSELFQIDNALPSTAVSVTWNGDFIFSDAVPSPLVATHGAALRIVPSDPSDQITTIFNGNVTFQNNMIVNPGDSSGGALAINSSHPVGSQTATIFNGKVLFQNNAVLASGGGVALGGALVNDEEVDSPSQESGAVGTIFNQQVSFINNRAQSDGLATGGAVLNALGAIMTFNQQALFSGNTATVSNNVITASLGGAFASIGPGSRVKFNAPVTFANNSAVNNSSTTVGAGTNSAYGGAIAVVGQGSIILANPQFIDNQAIAPQTFAYGGAIALANGTVTIQATDPSMPVLFQGNAATDSLGTRQEAIYLSAGDAGTDGLFMPGPSTLIFNTDANTFIFVFDGISSDGGGNQIIKQGLGTWQQGGNSRNYNDSTTIQAGTWLLLPGAVYGNTAAGAVTVLPSGVLVFSLAPQSFPLLQAQSIALDGQVMVQGIDAVLASLTPGTSFSQAVALSDPPIQTSVGPAYAGLVLAQGEVLLFDWALAFASPTELDVMITPRSMEDLGALVQAQGQSLTGGFLATQNQLNTFNVQLDQRLKSPAQSAFSDRPRIVLAFAENRLPFQYAVETPWAVWAQAMGGGGHLSQNGNFNGYTSNFSGLSAGADRAYEEWRFGLGINSQRSTLDWSAYSAQTRADGLALAFYGSYDNGPWYGHWQLGGGRTGVDNYRNPVFGGSPVMTAKSDSHVHFYNGRVATGYNFEREKTTLTPVAALAYVHSSNGAYTESGAGDLNLSVASNPQDNLEAQAGIEAMYATHLGPRRVGLRANVGLGYELMDRIVTLQTAFANFPQLPVFTVNSQNVGRLRAVLGAGVDIVVAKNIRLSVEYMGDFKRHVYNNSGAVTLKAVF